MTGGAHDLDAYALLAATSATLRDTLDELLATRHLLRALSVKLLGLSFRRTLSSKDLEDWRSQCASDLLNLESAVTRTQERLAHLEAVRTKLPVH